MPAEDTATALSKRMRFPFCPSLGQLAVEETNKQKTLTFRPRPHGTDRVKLEGIESRTLLHRHDPEPVRCVAAV